MFNSKLFLANVCSVLLFPLFALGYALGRGVMYAAYTGFPDAASAAAQRDFKVNAACVIGLVLVLAFWIVFWSVRWLHEKRYENKSC